VGAGFSPSKQAANFCEGREQRLFLFGIRFMPCGDILLAMNWKRITAEAAAMIIAAVLVGAGTNYIRPEARKLAWVADYRAPESGARIPASSKADREASPATLENPAALAPPKDPGLLYLDISSEVALRLHGAGALFIDARRSSVYEQGHIANAINVPVWEHDADGRVSGLQAKETKPDAVIVVYCSGGACEDSAMLALKLAQAGFYNIYLYKDGFSVWQSKGWPVARGKQP
jgi:rhodanese-related sulfurtransferase